MKLPHSTGSVSARVVGNPDLPVRVPMTWEEAEEQALFDEADAVFSGRVQKLETLELDVGGELTYRSRVTVLVNRTWKGEAAAGEMVSLLLPYAVHGESGETEIINRLSEGMKALFLAQTHTEEDVLSNDKGNAGADGYGGIWPEGRPVSHPAGSGGRSGALSGSVSFPAGEVVLRRGGSPCRQADPAEADGGDHLRLRVGDDHKHSGRNHHNNVGFIHCHHSNFLKPAVITTSPAKTPTTTTVGFASHLTREENELLNDYNDGLAITWNKNGNGGAAGGYYFGVFDETGSYYYYKDFSVTPSAYYLRTHLYGYSSEKWRKYERTLGRVLGWKTAVSI